MSARMNMYPLTCPLPSGWHTRVWMRGSWACAAHAALLLQRLIHYSPDLKNSLHTNCTAVIKQQGTGANYSWVSKRNGEEWDENNNKGEASQGKVDRPRPWRRRCLNTEGEIDLTSTHQPADKALDFISLWGRWGLNKGLYISPRVLINQVSFE